MTYRRLGHAGLKVSALALGSWVTYGNQMGVDVAAECMTAAYDAGVNFFDNAESYAHGGAETIMGEVLRKKGWRRASYAVSTKFYWGLNDGPNEKNTLNRKYLRQAIDGSLQRLQLDYVDLVFCHRADPDTPIEETVWAMHDMIAAGKALYWGTSEWSAGEIMAAWSAGVGPFDRQVQRRHPAGFARHAQELRLARPASDRSRESRGREKARADRGGSRLHARADVARLVSQEPERIDGDHRSEPRRTSRREHALARRGRQAHRGRDGPHRSGARAYRTIAMRDDACPHPFPLSRRRARGKGMMQPIARLHES